MSLNEEKETRERLLNNVKREVKQLMEVAVTRKFIHEDNSCIISLAAAIDACLLHGLKRRSIALFKTGTSMSLLQKISKNCEQAEAILQICKEYEETSNKENELQSNNNKNNDPNSSFSIFSKKIFSNESTNSSINQTDISKQSSNFTNTSTPDIQQQSLSKQSSLSQYNNTQFYKGSACYKFLWIRMALLNKTLPKIIEYIVQNASKYYLPSALCQDPVDGVILCSLLIGPCALEYTRMKTLDHIWSDPNADELLQRHRMRYSARLNIGSHSISSSGCGNSNILNRNSIPSSSTINNNNISNNDSGIFNQNSPKIKPALNSSIAAKRLALLNSTSLIEEINNSLNSTSPLQLAPPKTPDCKLTGNILSPTSNSIQSPISPNIVNNANSNSSNFAKDYVESIHQNSRSEIIYGKNNVFAQKNNEDLPGYLSLHLNSNGLLLKWTPNQLMNSSAIASPLQSENQTPQTMKTKSIFWNHAICIDINTIVYLHCHQQSHDNASIILVAQDGIQHTPFIFPKGTHLIQFLTCLENGLAPNGKLDPPLWNEHSGNGKCFPKLQRKSTRQKKKIKNNKISDVESNISSSSDNKSIITDDDDDDFNKDFVFRIINSKSNADVSDLIENDSPETLMLYNKVKLGDINYSNTNVSGSSFKSRVGHFFNSLTSFKSQNSVTSLDSFHSTPGYNNRTGEVFQFKSVLNNESDSNLNYSSKSDEITTKNTLLNSLSFKQPSVKASHPHQNTQLVKELTLSPIQSNNSNCNNEIKHNSYDSINRKLSGTKQTTALFQRNSSFMRACSNRSSLKSVCDTMKGQIVARAFYGWLAYHRHIKTINLHLSGLVYTKNHSNNQLDLFYNLNLKDNNEIEENYIKIKREVDFYLKTGQKLDENLWIKFTTYKIESLNHYKKILNRIFELIYTVGIDHSIRKKCWPYLLEHYSFKDCHQYNKEKRDEIDKQIRSNYINLIKDWSILENFIRRSEEETRKQQILVEQKDKQHKTPNNDSNCNDSGICLTKEVKKNLENKNNKEKTEITPVRPKAESSLSFFKFNLIKNKNNSEINDQNNDKTQKLTRTKQSEIIKMNENEVFINDNKLKSENISTPSLFSRFSTKNLFSKLISTKITDEDLQSMTQNEKISKDKINLDTKNEDNSIVIKELIEEIVIKAIDLLNSNEESLLNQEYNSTSTLNDETEQTIIDEDLDKTSSNQESISVYNSIKTALSNATSFDIEEIYQDANEDFHKSNSIIFNSNTLNNTPTLIKSRQQKLIKSEQNSIEKAIDAVCDKELVDNFTLNIHRIDKDVARCDRNYFFFMKDENLKKLKNIIYTYVWDNLKIGYIQGMCDLVAPLLVILEDEPLVYSCFTQLMKRMSNNFPHGTAMDENFSNMRTLIQILDSDLFEHMYQRGDYTHFFFSYRWFLLDFKRELLYDDVFIIWETIWSAKNVCTQNFNLFIALAFVETYRDIIIDNNMDFTDIIKFFNEMAEKHNTSEILSLARSLTKQLQNLIDENAN